MIDKGHALQMIIACAALYRCVEPDDDIGNPGDLFDQVRRHDQTPECLNRQTDESVLDDGGRGRTQGV